MRKLTLEEVHQHLLDMAVLFDAICTKHNIPYYMLGGTMLGAIRHKGFIPWDDDMDFGVPREYYSQLEQIMTEELKGSHYHYSTVNNSKHVIYGFCKLEDLSTRCDNAQIGADISENIGINIDVFPLDLCDRNDKAISLFIRINDLYGRIFTESATRSEIKGKIKKAIRWFLPFSQKSVFGFTQKLLYRIQQGKYRANLYGHWEYKEIIPQDWYGIHCKYEFCGHLLSGIQDYNSYLKQLYGDFMQLPPEDKRKTHSSNYYEL